jgi:hypothetical protein
LQRSEGERKITPVPTALSSRPGQSPSESDTRDRWYRCNFAFPFRPLQTSLAVRETKSVRTAEGSESCQAALQSSSFNGLTRSLAPSCPLGNFQIPLPSGLTLPSDRCKLHLLSGRQSQSGRQRDLKVAKRAARSQGSYNMLSLKATCLLLLTSVMGAPTSLSALQSSSFIANFTCCPGDKVSPDGRGI